VGNERTHLAVFIFKNTATYDNTLLKTNDKNSLYINFYEYDNVSRCISQYKNSLICSFISHYWLVKQININDFREVSSLHILLLKELYFVIDFWFFNKYLYYYLYFINKRKYIKNIVIRCYIKFIKYYTYKFIPKIIFHLII